MRLTDFQIQTICESAKNNFGKDTQVWLFGSRVDDHAKGGDIDLYIEPQTQNSSDLITAKLQFLILDVLNGIKTFVRPYI